MGFILREGCYWLCHIHQLPVCIGRVIMHSLFQSSFSGMAHHKWRLLLMGKIIVFLTNPGRIEFALNTLLMLSVVLREAKAPKAFFINSFDTGKIFMKKMLFLSSCAVSKTEDTNWAMS